MIIFVGSQNPVKINAVVNSASETWPNVRVEGLNIPSGISDQPLTDEETKLGAENRALKALEDGLASLKIKSDDQLAPATDHPNHNPNHNPEPEVLGIGLEGGVFTAEDGSLWNTVWASVADPNGFLASVSGNRFELKDPIASAIKSGKEMGPALSKMTGFAEINKSQGMIGVITNGFSDRTEAYASIAKLALGLWYGRNWPSSVRSTT